MEVTMSKYNIFGQEHLKKCVKCDEVKPHAEFHKCSSSRDGMNSWCKSCNNDYCAKRRQGSDFKEKQRAYQLKRSYGITVDEYDEMLREQGGRCRICRTDRPRGYGTEKGNLYVDHCHNTGKVRGLLCSRCNLSLGWLEKYKQDIDEYLD